MLSMAGVLLDYFKALLLPVGLSLDYNPAPVTRFADGIFPVAAGLAAAAAAALLFLRRRLEGLGLVILLAALLPAMNIWPIYNIKADRYLYLPLAGFSIAAAAAVRRLPSSIGARRFLAAAAVLWLGGLAFLSVAWSRNFDTNFSLFSAVVKKQPAVPRARANLSSAYLEDGNCAAALEQAEKAVRLDENPQMRLRLALTLARCRKPEAARKENETVLKALPRQADALYLAGLLLYSTDRRAARASLEKALREDPSNNDTRLTLILFGDKKAGDAAPRDKKNLERLKTFYRDIGLF
jgi:tetratricopeptide (TPR) repeat protein